jgi:hypothetical protein
MLTENKANLIVTDMNYTPQPSLGIILYQSLNLLARFSDLYGYKVELKSNSEEWESEQIPENYELKIQLNGKEEETQQENYHLKGENPGILCKKLQDFMSQRFIRQGMRN